MIPKTAKAAVAANKIVPVSEGLVSFVCGNDFSTNKTKSKTDFDYEMTL